MLPPPGPSETGRDLIVESEPDSRKLVVRDVHVGELWLCSGQSNMAAGLAEMNGDEPVRQSADPLLRLFQTGFHAPSEPAEDCKGKWTSLCETDKGGLHERFPKPEAASATGLSTRNLYLRFFIRNATAASHVRFRMGGDPRWGDASHTFHAAQWQLWLTSAE